MHRRIVCENIRSAYNVGNIIRTADALKWGIVISGYTPSPHTQPKVHKSSLGAHKSVPLVDFGDIIRDIQPAHERAQTNGYLRIAAEMTPTSISIDYIDITNHGDHILYEKKHYNGLAVRVGNEVTGVESNTLANVDAIVHIPMQGIKTSLNVGQAAAIIMRERR